VPSVRDDDRGGDTLTEPPWHERTPTVVGASIAALLALALLYFLISTVARQFNEPAQTPQYYLDPGDSSSSYRRSTTTTTTETITSTVPPITTEINPTDTSTSSSTDTSPNTNLPSTHRSTPSSGDESTSTRSRPRFNETRTLYPRPG
jgi:hypothetical protein